MFLYLATSNDIWPYGHKVTFDGESRQIIVNDGVFEINVKTDLYSAWKEWSLLRTNTKFLPAFRSIGGDPIDLNKGINAGDIYFLMNGWQIVIPHSVKVTGVIYHDDGIEPFVILAGGGVQSTVSNLVQTVVVPQASPAPSAAQIAAEVKNVFTPEMNHLLSLQNGLTASQATMLIELYAIMGLDPTKPLVVTDTSRTAGDISQSINSTTNQTTVTRL